MIFLFLLFLLFIPHLEAIAYGDSLYAQSLASSSANFSSATRNTYESVFNSSFTWEAQIQVDSKDNFTILHHPKFIVSLLYTDSSDDCNVTVAMNNGTFWHITNYVTSFPVNQWNHLMVTHDSSLDTTTIFLDGSSIVSKSSPGFGSIESSNGIMKLAQGSYYIDEVKLHSIAYGSTYANLFKNQMPSNGSVFFDHCVSYFNFDWLNYNYSSNSYRGNDSISSSSYFQTTDWKVDGPAFTAALFFPYGADLSFNITFTLDNPSVECSLSGFQISPPNTNGYFSICNSTSGSCTNFSTSAGVECAEDANGKRYATYYTDQLSFYNYFSSNGPFSIRWLSNSKTLITQLYFTDPDPVQVTQTGLQTSVESTERQLIEFNFTLSQSQSLNVSIDSIQTPSRGILYLPDGTGNYSSGIPYESSSGNGVVVTPRGGAGQSNDYTLFLNVSEYTWGNLSIDLVAKGDFGLLTTFSVHHDISGLPDNPIWVSKKDFVLNSTHITDVALAITSKDIKVPPNQDIVLDSVTFLDPDAATEELFTGNITFTISTSNTNVSFNIDTLYGDIFILSATNQDLQNCSFIELKSDNPERILYGILNGDLIASPTVSIVSNTGSITMKISDGGFGPAGIATNVSFTYNFEIVSAPLLSSIDTKYLAQGSDTQFNLTGSNFYNEPSNYLAFVGGLNGGYAKCKYSSPTELVCETFGSTIEFALLSEQTVELAWRNAVSAYSIISDSVNATIIPNSYLGYVTQNSYVFSAAGGETLTFTVSNDRFVNDVSTCSFVYFEDEDQTMVHSVLEDTSPIYISSTSYSCTIPAFPSSISPHEVKIFFTQNNYNKPQIGYYNLITTTSDICTSTDELPFRQKERIDAGLEFWPNVADKANIQLVSGSLAPTSSNTSLVDGDRCCSSPGANGFCGFKFDNSGLHNISISFDTSLYVNQIVISHDLPCANLPLSYSISHPANLVSRTTTTGAGQCGMIKGSSGPTATCVDLFDPVLVDTLYFDYTAGSVYGHMTEVEVHGLFSNQAYDLAFNNSVFSSAPIDPISLAKVLSSDTIFDFGDVNISSQDFSGILLGSIDPGHSITVTCQFSSVIPNPSLNIPAVFSPCSTTFGSSGTIKTITIPPNTGYAIWSNVSLYSPPVGVYKFVFSAPTIFRDSEFVFRIQEGSPKTLVSNWTGSSLVSGNPAIPDALLYTVADGAGNPLNTPKGMSLYPGEHQVNLSIAFLNGTEFVLSPGTFNDTESITSVMTVNKTATFSSLLFQDPSASLEIVCNATSDFDPTYFQTDSKISVTVGSPTLIFIEQNTESLFQPTSAFSFQTPPIIQLFDSAFNPATSEFTLFKADILPYNGTNSPCSVLNPIETATNSSLISFSSLGFSGTRGGWYFIEYSDYSGSLLPSVSSPPFQVAGCSGNLQPDQSCGCQCNKGYYKPEESETCLRCDRDSYKSVIGDQPCTSCAPLRATLSVGSQSISSCMCKEGYYQNPLAEEFEKYSSSSCLNCLKGGICSGPIPSVVNGSQLDILPAQGYWVDKSDPYTLYKCPHSPACPGGKSAECAQGYEGPVCGICTKGYGSFGNSCSICDGNQSLNWALVIIFFLVLLSACIYLVKTANTVRSEATVLIKQAITFLQFLALASSLEVQDWPSDVKGLFATANVALIDINFLSLECTLKIDYYGSFLLYCTLPLVMIFAPLFYLGVRKILGRYMPESTGPGPIERAIRRFQRKRLTEEDSESLGDISAIDHEVIQSDIISSSERKYEELVSKTTALIIVLVSLTYPTTSKRILAHFNCVNYGDSSYVASDLSIECNTEQHIFWQFIAVLMIIFYCFGIPIGFWIILHQNKDRLDDPRFQHRFLSIYDGYTREKYYWESILMFRKLAFVGIIVFIRNSPDFQTFAAQWLIISFVLQTMWAKPFQIDLATRLELFTNGILFVVVSLATLLYFETLSTSSSSTLILVVIVVLIGSSALYLGFVGLYVINYRLRQYFPQQHAKAEQAVARSLVTASFRIRPRLPSLADSLHKVAFTLDQNGQETIRRLSTVSGDDSVQMTPLESSSIEPIPSPDTIKAPPSNDHNPSPPEPEPEPQPDTLSFLPPVAALSLDDLDLNPPPPPEN